MGKSNKINHLTEAEKYYIEINPKNLPLPELAAELNRDIELVRPHYKDKPVNRNDLPLHYKNCTIMTEAASAAAQDSLPERMKNRNDISKYKKSIHKCRD